MRGRAVRLPGGAGRWTVEEDRMLREMYAAGRQVKAIAVALGRSRDAVTARRRQLGVAARCSPTWSPREDALVRAAAAGGVPASRLAASLGRTPDAVRWRRRVLIDRPSAPARYRPADDEAILRCFADDGELEALAHGLGRSVDAMRLRAQALGVHQPSRRARWSAPEDAIIRDGYGEGLTCANIARRVPGRTPAAVAARAAKLGLADYARRWKAEDDMLLARLVAAQRPATYIARALVRTPEAVRQRCRHLGLAGAPPPPAARAGRPWSEQEDELLCLHAGVNPATLAQLLGRSDVAVAARLRSLGLRATRERSPHHPTPRADRLTPGQRSAIQRTRKPISPTALRALARRLETAPTAVQNLIERTTSN